MTALDTDTKESLERLTPHIKIEGEINQLPDRAAMGLPETYMKANMESIEQAFYRCKKHTIDEWISIIESEDYPLEEHLAAGQYLALSGDPRINTLSPTMVLLPQATVNIGVPFERVTDLCKRYQAYAVKPEWLEKECPQFSVTIPRFHLAKYPVTNKEYLDFLKENEDGEIPSSWELGRYPFSRANAPVYTIKPATAERYCRWLSERTGRAFRLPTEYEWEYAASGPKGHEFPWGEEFIPAAANTLELGYLSTTPVGLFPNGMSHHGIMDLAGNVEEYVQDTYHAYPGGRIVKDDLFEMVGSDYRIARGGAFNRFHDMARSRRRHGGPLQRSLYAMGFRIAESL